MKKFIFLFILFGTSLLFPQWTKQGTLNGNITDVEVINWDGASGLIYVSTSGSGIFKSNDGINWEEANGFGDYVLPDFNVKAIARIPSYDNYLVAACSSGVWITYDKGDKWQDFNSGLFSTNISPIPRDIAVSYYSGNYYFYLATYGAGVFRKVGSTGSWVPFNDGELEANNDYYCISIGAQGDKALVGTRRVSNVSTSGHLYTLSGDNTWYRVYNYTFPQNVSIPAISYRFPDFAFVSVGYNPTSGEYEGIWFSTDAINFNKLANSGMPKDQPFLSLDYGKDGSTYSIVGGTTKRLYKIPSPSSTDPYQFVPFTGAVTGVGVGKICDVFFGGPGKGPYITDICNITEKPTPIRDGIKDLQISDIAVSSQFDVSDYGVFAASRISGLYKNQEVFSSESDNRGYFTRMIGNPDNLGMPDVICVATSPNYKENGKINLHELDVFAGTNGEGILKSTDGGRSWYYSNGSGTTTLPEGAIITDIKLSPNYQTDGTIFASVYGYGVYKSTDYGANWTLTANMTNKNVLSIALDPNYPSLDYIYAGCRSASNGTLPTFFVYNAGEWVAKTSYYGTINSVTAGKTEDTPHIYIGTALDGILITPNRGNSFSSFNNGLYSANNFVFKVLVPLSYYYEYGTKDNRFLISAIRPNNTSGDGGFYWYSFLDNRWYPFNSNLPDQRIISLGIAPNFTYKGHIFCGHINQSIYTAYIHKDSGPQNGWTPAEGFFTTPKRINGIAVDPSDSNIVIAATDDMGVFISFDKGETFRPWSKGLTYTASSNTYVVQKTLSIDITDKWSGLYPDLRTAILGTSGQGIYYVDFDHTNSSIFYYPQWYKATMTPSTTGNINEIRYTSVTEDIRASDSVYGDYHSANIGASWALTTGSPSVGLTNMSFASSVDLKRGLNQFIWGCSSGKSLSLRSGICTNNGKAWYFDPTPDQWYQCSTTGLDTCEDFRAILKLSSGAILMGSKDIGGTSTSWAGMYRSDDNCSSWEVSNEGLPANPKVYELQQLSNGDILAGLDGITGGVFLSDASSNGYAWVKVNSGFSPSVPGSVELSSDGSTIYSGMSEDGIYASGTVINYTGVPTAYFTSPPEGCINTNINFDDYSAGRVTSWYWNFGDSTYSSERNPVHPYSSTGIKNVSLQVSNGYNTDTYSRSIEIKPELEVEIRVVKNGSDVLISWNDLSDETGYGLYLSNSPSSGIYYSSLPQDATGILFPSGYTYARIQAVSTSYVCGDGPVGGSW